MACSNLCCKHHQEGNVCGTVAEIGAGAKCQSFEKGLLYYFSLVWSALKHKNFIDGLELTPDLKIGLYCVMTAYHLGYSAMEWGTCRMYALRTGEDGPMLKTSDIIALPVDESAVKRIGQELERGALASMATGQPQPAKKSQPYGWLSPTGTFTEGDFGEHDAVARELIRKNGFWEEFRSWWYVAPTIINTFLEHYDLTGKTIIPFATSGGSGMGDTNQRLRPSCSGATLLPGKLLNGRQSKESLTAWLSSIPGVLGRQI